MTYGVAEYEERCVASNEAGQNVMIATICDVHMKPMMNAEGGGWRELSCGCRSGLTTVGLRELLGVCGWSQPYNLVVAEGHLR